MVLKIQKTHGEGLFSAAGTCGRNHIICGNDDDIGTRPALLSGVRQVPRIVEGKI
jgi:hypothetical protein